MSKDNVSFFAPGETLAEESMFRRTDGRTEAQGDIERDYSLVQRMGRLVRAVIEGRVVPFLGAGISMYAPPRLGHESDAPTLKAVEIAENLGKVLHDSVLCEHEICAPVGHLVRLALKTAGYRKPDARLLNWLALNDDDLGEQFHRALKEHPQANSSGQQASRSGEQGGGESNPAISVKRGSPRIREITPPLGEVAELCWAILGPAKTCDVLRLKEWNRRLPTPAHHYLAVLVREGLVTEILETNYDEFVEEAVLETFGSGHRKREAAPVIHDLESYRKYIAQPRRHARHEALVKVIKLNGCAAAYRDRIDRQPRGDDVQTHRDEVARKIILTEEQLQSWGEKAWAQELLRDRIRSRSLLFIGFGNQDPIVRHHAVAVIREFNAHQTEQTRWFELENAPFVMAYEKDLSFFQFQMLRAFRDAHEASASASSGMLGQVATVYMNAFLGHDGPAFDRSQGPALPADLFLKRLAGLAVCKHISEVYCSSDSAVGSYLRGALRQPESLLDHVKRTLLKGDVANPAPFERWLYLENESPNAQTSSPWSDVCFAIRGEDAGRAGYRPFSDAPVKQPMLLALMTLLAIGEQTPPPDPEGLRQRCRLISHQHSVAGFRLLQGDTGQGKCPLYATSYLDAFMGDTDPRLDADIVRERRSIPNGAVVILLGRGSQGAFRCRKWVAIDEGGKEKMLHEVIAIGDLAALRGCALGPVSLANAKRNLDQLTQEPEEMLRFEESWQDYCEEV